MSMHMERAWLTTTGKKKGKVKYKSAEAKRQAEQLAKEWEALKEKHRGNQVSKTNTGWTYSLSVPPGRTTNSHIRSNGSGVGVATAQPVKVYTGDEVLGIAVMHKSCLQPVFSQEAAKDSASMRR